MRFVAGIDGGGTKTTVLCQSPEGEFLARRVFGPLNYNSVGEEGFLKLLGQITDFLNALGSCQALCIGIAGYSNPDVERAVADAMIHAGILQWRLAGDHEIALRSALDKRIRCVLIAGTGSICCGISSSGKIIRAGGWGHLIGDEGSGYAVGKDALAAVACWMDGGRTKTILTELLGKKLGLDLREDIIRYAYSGGKDKLAAIAPLVVEAAQDGDEAAREILRRHAGKLAEMVHRVIGRISADNSGDVALMGGMLERPTLYRKMVIEAIQKSLPEIRCTSSSGTPEEGAAALAKDLLERKAEKAVFENPICSDAALGVDIGGSTITFAVVRNGRIIHKRQIKTPETFERILNVITEQFREIREQYAIETVGIGVPGSIQGSLVFASNLPFDGVPLERILSERLDISVSIENDANCAALGEMMFGGSADFKNIVLITLGTGIGGGIIINRRICRGKGGIGEIGHMTVQMRDGLECPCGNTGCWERYASVSALVRQAEKAARENTSSILYGIYCRKNGCLGGKDIFDAIELGCETTRHVLDVYLSNLAVGIKSLNKILDPDVFVLTGGITMQGEKLLSPLKKKLGSKILVKISNLQEDAGVLGAAMLEKNRVGDLL